jgi:hypothetical protein
MYTGSLLAAAVGGTVYRDKIFAARAHAANANQVAAGNDTARFGIATKADIADN